MSWYSKVFWSEGLFLRPHHLQQNDRYVEHLLEKRVRYVTPHPWGFAELEIDHDLTQQSKFAVRSAAGVMPDGIPFDIPADSPIPEAIEVPDSAAGQIVWLMMPVAAPNTREVDEGRADSASRYVRASETFIDSTSSLRVEEEIDIAFQMDGNYQQQPYNVWLDKSIYSRTDNTTHPTSLVIMNSGAPSNS